ncbi:MAG: HAD-IA family hydrolase [Pseudomonadota bacterium]
MLDVDGVLVDGRPIDGKRWNSNLEEDLGVAPQVLVDVFFSKQWKEVVAGKRDLMEALSESLTAASLSVKAEELVSYWFSMDSRIVESVFDDCKAAKKQGVSVFLATNQEHKRATYLMESMDLRSVVDGIVYSAKAGHQKPHPEFYSYASRFVGFQPNQLLLVDDIAANIKGAHEAGWEAVLWDGSESLADILRRSFK